MKTKTINIYELSELSKEAKQKAHENWRIKNDYPFLKEDMLSKLDTLLEANKIKTTGERGVYFSLSNCQGDGVMFYGSFEWKKYTVWIKHSGHYNHSNSKSIEIQETKNPGFHIDDEYEPESKKNIYTIFEKIYQSICKELEVYGYAVMTAEDDEESFRMYCESNEVEFLEDGNISSMYGNK